MSETPEDIRDIARNFYALLETAKDRLTEAEIEQGLSVLQTTLEMKRREATLSRPIEAGLLALGAAGTFNRFDQGYGDYLVQVLKGGGNLTRRVALQAYTCLQRYESEIGELPPWTEMSANYELCAVVRDESGAVAPKRVALDGLHLVVVAPYDPTGAFQQQAKTIPNYAYQATPIPHWRYPAEQVEAVCETFSPTLGYWFSDDVWALLVEFKTRREAWLAYEAELAIEREAKLQVLIEAAGLGDTFYRPDGEPFTLFQHQKEGVAWLLSHHQGFQYRGGILADEMGLGKTLQSLIAARALKRVYDCPVFVVAPASIQGVWQEEAGIAQLDIECYTWGKIPTPIDKPYVLIADEAHYAQAGTKSQRGKAFLELSRTPTCLAAYCLTGTPMKNGAPINLFPLLQATGHPLGQNKSEYEKHFCKARVKTINKAGMTKWDNQGAAHLDELSQQTTDVILRRRKHECTDLPPKTRTMRPVELSQARRLEYHEAIEAAIEAFRDRADAKMAHAEHADVATLRLDLVARAHEKLKDKLERDEELRRIDDASDAQTRRRCIAMAEAFRAAEALVTLNNMRQIGSLYKAPAAIEFALDLRQEGEQVVLFTAFLPSAEQIVKTVGKKHATEYLHGGVPIKERKPMMDRFQAGESTVWVSTIAAGGTGLTLHAASHVLLVDRPWTPGDAMQAEDRCHRIGQYHPVSAYWMQLGEVDLAIDTLLQAKGERIELVLKGKRKTFRGVNRSARDLALELIDTLSPPTTNGARKT